MPDRISTPIPPLRLTGARAVVVRPASNAGETAGADLSARADAMRDTFQFSRIAQPTSQAGGPRSGMIAASVPGPVDFAADAPSGSAGLPMYRHPADRNAAATAVDAGRCLDVEG